MKPFSSSARQPRSHSVRGDAPVMMNTCWMSCVEISPVFLSCQVTRSRCSSALERDDLGVEMQFDLGILRQPLDQVSRHGAGQLPRPHQHVHLARGLRQEHRGLPGRVSPSHHGDLVAAAQLRLDVSGAVVDALAFELLQIREPRFVVLRPGGDHDGARWQRLSAVEHHLIRALVAVEPHHAARDHHGRAELLRLRGGARGQFLPGDSGREAQVVLDLRTRSRLPAGSAASRSSAHPVLPTPRKPPPPDPPGRRPR